MKKYLLKNSLCLLLATSALMLFTGCGNSNHDSHGHSHADGHSHAHAEEHAPPHGGTPVIVAEDKFHLELVLDASAGKMQAYILDGHLEKYVQVPETSFVIAAMIGGKSEQLAFRRVPEPGAASLPEKSSLFEAQADWLKTAKEFQGSIATITLNGVTFTNISFPFPKGTKHVH